MQTPVSAVDVAAPIESAKPAVNWGPIVAGAMAASTITVVLLFVGSGLGLTMVSPWSGRGAGMTTIAASTAAWLVVVQWLSAAVGGYLAGRLRTRWVGVHSDEVYFRDTAHGFMAWALATLLVVGVLGSALSAALGSGVQAVSNVASGAAQGAAAGTTDEAAGNATGYFADALFRPADPARLASPGTTGGAVAEASRILIAGAAAGEVSAEDRTYLAQLVAARAGLSEADAKARVDAVLARAQEAKTKAQETADTARKAGATFSLVTALSLAIGAFIASVAALIGGNQRDAEEDVYLSQRG